MKPIWLAIIAFYQRVISPRKGFHCAHHVLHKGDTCSNAVKDLISSKGLVRAWPYIRIRFSDCRHAYQQLSSRKTTQHHSDIPCDIGCDAAFGDCGGGSTNGSNKCAFCCDVIPLDCASLSRRTWKRLLVIATLITMIAGYWFYGRAIVAIEIEDTGALSVKLFNRLTQRSQPNIKALIIVNGKKYYSASATLSRPNTVYSLKLANPPLSFQVDSVQILDSRIGLMSNKIHVNQVLEEFNPAASGAKGKRFKYQLVRRWHIF